MLEKQNMNNFKSESLHFPNVGTLMKISLGLILFTMISTVLVYAQTSDDAVFKLLKMLILKIILSMLIILYFHLHLDPQLL